VLDITHPTEWVDTLQGCRYSTLLYITHRTEWVDILYKTLLDITHPTG